MRRLADLLAYVAPDGAPTAASPGQGLVAAVLAALAQAGAVPEGADWRNIPAALARRAEEQP